MNKTCFFIGHRETGPEIMDPFAAEAERPIKIPPYFDGIFYPSGMEAVPRRLAVVRANRYIVDNNNFLIAYA